MLENTGLITRILITGWWYRPIPGTIKVHQDFLEFDFVDRDGSRQSMRVAHDMVDAVRSREGK